MAVSHHFVSALINQAPVFSSFWLEKLLSPLLRLQFGFPVALQGLLLSSSSSGQHQKHCRSFECAARLFWGNSSTSKLRSPLQRLAMVVWPRPGWGEQMAVAVVVLDLVENVDASFELESLHLFSKHFVLHSLGFFCQAAGFAKMSTEMVTLQHVWFYHFQI